MHRQLSNHFHMQAAEGGKPGKEGGPPGKRRRFDGDDADQEAPAVPEAEEKPVEVRRAGKAAPREAA